MPLELPQRVPVTHPDWLRFFEELRDRTGTTDTDLVSSAVREAREAQAGVGSLRAGVWAVQLAVRAVLGRVRALEMVSADDRLARVALERARRARFLGDFGWR